MHHPSNQCVHNFSIYNTMAHGSGNYRTSDPVEKSWIRPKRHYDELVGTIRQCNS